MLDEIVFMIDDENGNDFELCFKSYLHMVDKYKDNFSINIISNQHKKNVILATHATGIIKEGGFQLLFEKGFKGDP